MKLLEPPVPLEPSPPASPGRVRRLQDHRRRVRWITFVAVLAVFAVALASSWAARRVAAPVEDERPGTTAPTIPERTMLVALAVRTGNEPLVGVIGSGGNRDPAAIAMPTSALVNLPGQGEGRFRDAVDQSAAYLRLAASNVLGTWVDHAVVLDLEGLAQLVDRSGGAVVGGAPQSGQQVADSFAVPGPNRAIRWHEVLESILAQGIVLESSDVVEAVGASEAAAVLARAKGAIPQSLPTIQSEGGLLTPDDAAIDTMTAELFAVQGPIVPLIVLNGAGRPGLGQAVAERLVPEGYRIVVSENASRFGRTRTQIVAASEAALPTAREIRELLGVGTVSVSGVPSGLADITIVVGRDFRTG
jgi:hypothetical protein